MLSNDCTEELQAYLLQGRWDFEKVKPGHMADFCIANMKQINYKCNYIT